MIALHLVESWRKRAASSARMARDPGLKDEVLRERYLTQAAQLRKCAAELRRLYAK